MRMYFGLLAQFTKYLRKLHTFATLINRTFCSTVDISILIQWFQNSINCFTKCQQNEYFGCVYLSDKQNLTCEQVQRNKFIMRRRKCIRVLLHQKSCELLKLLQLKGWGCNIAPIIIIATTTFLMFSPIIMIQSNNPQQSNTLPDHSLRCSNAAYNNNNNRMIERITVLYYFRFILTLKTS